MNQPINFNLLMNLPSNNQMGSLLHSIAHCCKLTTPYVIRELHYLQEQQLVEVTYLGMLWRRTASGDQLLEHELNKSYM